MAGLIKEKLTVRRNNNKMQEGTLRMLSMKTVIHNVAFFINNSSLVHRVENLPEVLKTDLEDLLSNYAASSSPLFQATSMRMSWWRFRALLLHSHLPKLRLPRLYHCSNEHELDVGIGYLMDQLAAKCSGLLLIDDESQTMIEEVVLTPEKEVFINEAFFRALPTLSNLRVVKIELFLCDDWALQQFAMHCQNIVILQVALAVPEVSDVGIQALAKLTHLKQFLFDNYRKEFKTLKLVLKYYLLCARYLPNLKIVGHEYTGDLDDYDYQYYDEDGEYFSHSPILQLPLVLGLEQVLLNWEVVTKPLCLLPNLRSLLLYSSSREYTVGLCNRYSSISELGLCDAAIETIVAALQVVGKRLEKLIVFTGCTFSGIVLPLDLILKLCPNLKHLKVDHYWLENVDYSYLKDDVRCLQTIDLNFNKRQPLPHGFLITMLGAPLLKKVGFWGLYPTKAEVDALLTSVWQGNILTNLKSFKWISHYLVNDTIMHPWMTSQIHFQLLLDSIQVLLVQN